MTRAQTCFFFQKKMKEVSRRARTCLNVASSTDRWSILRPKHSTTSGHITICRRVVGVHKRRWERARRRRAPCAGRRRVLVSRDLVLPGGDDETSQRRRRSHRSARPRGLRSLRTRVIRKENNKNAFFYFSFCPASHRSWRHRLRERHPAAAAVPVLAGQLSH